MNAPIRHLVLDGHDPRGWGEQHGESLRAEIRQAYSIRLALMLQKTNLGTEDEVLELATLHLPLLQRFDEALFQELSGISRAAGVSLAQLVVLNHYTDLRDLGLRHIEEARASIDGDAGCSVIFSPGPSGHLLGQTWDMHGSATDFVHLLDVPTRHPTTNEPGRTLLFTLAGCIGMTGMTSWSLGMTINNLNSLDARIGVVWPALVRKALRTADAMKARDVVLHAPLGSGHHYMVADPNTLFGIETSGTKKKVTQSGVDAPHIHTNHCLDVEMQSTCRILSTSTTLSRYERLDQMRQTAAWSDLPSVWDALAQVSSDRSPQDPHGVATCGAFLMNLATQELWACAGMPRPAAEGIPSSFVLTP